MNSLKKKITFLIPNLEYLLEFNAVHVLNNELKQYWQKSSYSISFHDQIRELFSLPLSQDFPFGAMFAVNYNLPNAKNAYWAQLRPVELKADLAGIYLLGSSHLQLSLEEEQYIVDELNHWGCIENIKIHHPAQGIFLLESEKTLDLQTFLLIDIFGKEMSAYLPAGTNYLAWHKYLTEWQLILHALPFNQLRARKGLPPANGVWLEGVGAVPLNIESKNQLLITDALWAKNSFNQLTNTEMVIAVKDFLEHPAKLQHCADCIFLFNSDANLQHSFLDELMAVIELIKKIYHNSSVEIMTLNQHYLLKPNNWFTKWQRWLMQSK